MRGGVWIANAAGKSPTTLSLFANLPLPSSVPVGTQFRVSEYGPPPGIIVENSGIEWIYPYQLLGRVYDTVNGPNDVNENVLASFAIPPLAKNSNLYFRALVSATNSANVKTWRTRFNGNQDLSFGSTVQVVLAMYDTITCKNTLTSQEHWAFVAATINSVGQWVENVGQPSIYTFTLQKDALAVGELASLRSADLFIG